MAALTNNALSAAAEAGTIDVTSRESGERTAAHELWTSMLALVVALVSALGEGTQFVEQEVTGFARLYAAQIARSLAWTTTTPLTLAALEELQAVASLAHGVVRNADARSADAAVLAAQAVLLLQQINNALIYPRALAGLLRPVSPEERGLMERDVAATDVEPDKRSGLDQRPVMARVTLAFLQIQRSLLDALVAHSDAFRTLACDEIEWRVDRAIILPVRPCRCSVFPLPGPADLCESCSRCCRRRKCRTWARRRSGPSLTSSTTACRSRKRWQHPAPSRLLRCRRSLSSPTRPRSRRPRRARLSSLRCC
mgnify:FL=1